MKVTVETTGEKETKELARRLTRFLKKGDILCLRGDLGSGKTTFVKGLAKGLRIKEEEVNSPTFVLLNIYKGKMPLFHFDLYRLSQPSDIEGIGYEEFFYGEGISVVEWAEKLEHLYPKTCLSLTFVHQGEDKRSISLSADDGHLEEAIGKIKGAKAA